MTNPEGIASSDQFCLRDVLRSRIRIPRDLMTRTFSMSAAGAVLAHWKPLEFTPHVYLGNYMEIYEDYHYSSSRNEIQVHGDNQRVTRTCLIVELSRRV